MSHARRRFNVDGLLLVSTCDGGTGMALEGWEAGELWAQLREHTDPDRPSWCPVDRKRDCPAAGYAREKLTESGLLEKALEGWR